MTPSFGVLGALTANARRCLLVARLAFHGRFREEDDGLLALPASIADTDALLACADDEDLLTLTVRALLATEGFDGSLIGEQWHARVAERRRWSEMRLMLLQTLFDALAADGVDAIVIKGSPLSQELYGDPHLRDHHDIDLVVAPDQAHAAARVLSRYGLVATCDIGWFARPLFLRSLREASFRSLRGAFEVDLHWRIDQPWNPQWTPVEPLLATSVPIRLPGGVTVRTQSPEATHRLLASNLIGGGTLELRSIVDWATSLLSLGQAAARPAAPPPPEAIPVWSALERVAEKLLAPLNIDSGGRKDARHEGRSTRRRRLDRLAERWCADVLTGAPRKQSNGRFVQGWQGYLRLLVTRLKPGLADYAATSADANGVSVFVKSFARRAFALGQTRPTTSGGAAISAKD